MAQTLIMSVERYMVRASAIAALVLLSACAALPVASKTESLVIVDVLSPATVQTVVLEAGGPGIEPAVVLNLAVGADSVARDSLRLTAGSGRRLVATAFDTLGVPTHRSDTTVTLSPGQILEVGLVLRPLSTRVGITVTFGNLKAPVPR